MEYKIRREREQRHIMQNETDIECINYKVWLQSSEWLPIVGENEFGDTAAWDRSSFDGLNLWADNGKMIVQQLWENQKNRNNNGDGQFRFEFYLDDCGLTLSDNARFCIRPSTQFSNIIELTDSTSKAPVWISLMRELVNLISFNDASIRCNWSIVQLLM